MTYPIAEQFHSPQGEGFWVGVQMHFIRLAGCNVGKMLGEGYAPPHLTTTRPASQCCTLSGQKFWCDTDYDKRFSRTPDELLKDTYEEHICLTGGEPFLHDLKPLCDRAAASGVYTHIESSGTLAIPPDFETWHKTWLTVCPKEGARPDVMKRANEIKILLRAGEDPFITYDPDFLKSRPLVYIQPINFEKSVNEENMRWCLRMLEFHPTLRLSAQLHKYLEVR